MASPKTQVLARTESLADRAVSTIETLDKPNNAAQLVENQLFSVEKTPPTTPQYLAKKDTTSDPMTDFLKKLKVENIDKMDVIKSETGENAIRLTLKDGTTQEFKGKAAIDQLMDAEKRLKLADEIKAAEELQKKWKAEGKTAETPSTEGRNKAADEKAATDAYNQKLSDEKKGETVFTVVEQQPEFTGGLDSMFRFLGRNVQYPKIARDKNVEGTVYVGFVVEMDGSISEVKVKREPTYPKDSIQILTGANGARGYKLVPSAAEGSLGREAMRVVASMPKWKPGKQKGKPVRVAYTLPIKFKLD